MATTTNIGLTKPAGTDKALVSVINSNSDIIDSAAGGLMDAIAIVANGNTHAAISAGQYVYVHNHGTLAEGLYTANSAIAANATLSTSNLTADASGGLNALNSKIFNNLSSTTDFNTITTDGIYKFDWVSGGTSYHRPVNQGGQLITCTQGQVKMQIYSTSSNGLFVRGYHDNAWEDWKELALKSETTPLYKEVNGTSKSVANSTWQELAQITLPAGTWLIIGEADYSSNDTGIRILMITYTETDTQNKPENSVLSTGRAILSRQRILRTTQDITVYLRAYQTSGNSLSCIGNMRCVRLNTTWETI